MARSVTGWLPGLALLAVALAGAAQVAGGQSAAPQAPRASWLDPAGDAARGRGLAQACAACHAPGGAGPRLYNQRASYTFFALRDYQNGARRKAAMASVAVALSDQDMRDLAAHFAGLAPVKPPEPRRHDPYHARAARDCTWCHGESGIGELEGMPILTGQNPDYLVAALEEYRSGARSNRAMRAVAARLTAADSAGLAGYYGGYGWLEAGR